MNKIIIAGGRDFTNYELLKDNCNYFLSGMLDKSESIEIVSGHANGADKLGEKYAIKKKYPLRLFHADWDKFGKAAGPIRNTEMANYATHLIAFWDNKSSGTADMIKQAKIKGLKIRIVKYA